MPRFEIDVDPCDHITADAIGKPGQRVFYIQAFQDQRTITRRRSYIRLRSASNNSSRRSTNRTRISLKPPAITWRK